MNPKASLTIYGKPKDTVRTAARFLWVNLPGLMIIAAILGGLIEVYYRLLVPRPFLGSNAAENAELRSLYALLNTVSGMINGVPRFLISSFGILCCVLMAARFSRDGQRCPLRWALRTAGRLYFPYIITSILVQLRILLLILICIPVLGAFAFPLVWLEHSLLKSTLAIQLASAVAGILVLFGSV